MPPLQTIINIDDDKLKAILEKVESRQPEKPQQGMTQRVIITKSSPIINLAAQRGYTYDEIAAILSDSVISVKGATLKQYSASSTQSKLRKPEQNQTAAVETPTEAASREIPVRNAEDSY